MHSTKHTHNIRDFQSLTAFTLSGHLWHLNKICVVFSSSSELQALGLRSSLDLRLANHRAMAIAFQLEYVFSVPIGQELTVSVLRWGSKRSAHCPTLKSA